MKYYFLLKTDWSPPFYCQKKDVASDEEINLYFVHNEKGRRVGHVTKGTDWDSLTDATDTFQVRLKANNLTAELKEAWEGLRKGAGLLYRHQNQALLSKGEKSF